MCAAGASEAAFSALVDAGFKADPSQIQLDKEKLQRELEGLVMWQTKGDDVSCPRLPSTQQCSRRRSSQLQRSRDSFALAPPNTRASALHFCIASPNRPSDCAPSHREHGP